MEYVQEGLGSNQTLDSKVQKLVILFVFDKMAIPLAETTLLDICSSDNNWLSYMECKQYLAELLDTNLVYRVPKSEMLNITQDGVSCLSLFFTKIPSSIRDEIVEYARENRMRFKKTPILFLRLLEKRRRHLHGDYAHQQRHHHPDGTQTRGCQPPTCQVPLQKLGGQGVNHLLSHLRQPH